MSNKKQTAVDFLTQQILDNWNDIQAGRNIFEFVEQAKAMHKEEVTSFTADWSIQFKYENGKSINEYYKETYEQQ